MARKIVTTKSQIPKYAQKRIKGFKQLTKNEAIFEYERYLLYRRANGEYKNIVKNLPRPQMVTTKDIKALYEQRGKKLADLSKSYNALPDVTTDEDKIPDILERARELLNELIKYIDEESNKAIISYSAYRSGKTRSSRSLTWVSNNISSASTLLITRIEEILSRQELMLTFAKKCEEGEYLGQLQDAIGDYVIKSYAVIDTDSYFMSHEVYRLLSFGPMSLDEVMSFDHST